MNPHTSQEAKLPSSRAEVRGYGRLFVTWLVLVALTGGSLILVSNQLPPWPEWLLIGLCIFIAMVFVWRVRELVASDGSAGNNRPIADAATSREQQATLAQLASLPQFRQLPDGSLFDYVQGGNVTVCRCGQYSPLHLKVRYGKGRRHAIALVSRGALAHYLAVQTAIARVLMPPTAEASLISTKEGAA